MEELKQRLLDAMAKCQASIKGDYKDIATEFPNFLEDTSDVPSELFDGFSCPRAFWEKFEELTEE